MYIASLTVGGSERVCADLCNGFITQGVKVELLLVNAFGAYLAQLDSRVRVVDFKASRGLNALGRVSRHLRKSPKIPVLVFGFNLGVALLLARRLRLHKAPVIYREGSSPKWYLKPLQRWGYPWGISKADKVIAQSNAAREELSQLGVPADKMVVIPNPCRSAASPARHPERASNESPLVLGIGRLSPEKGFDRLIRGFQRFRSAMPSARLVILGEGPERERLDRLIVELGLKECVSLPGFVSEVTSWYERADVFALSSHYEGQPNSLIEAILHQCPVVCAAGHGGTIELIQAAGLEDCLVPDDQFEELFADRLRAVLNLDLSRWQRAREKLAALTDFETVLQRYLSVCGIESGCPDPVRS